MQKLIRRGLGRLARPLRSDRVWRSIERVRRRMTPISDDVVRSTLDKLLRSTPRVMLMHSSLSSCGRFTAGPESILNAVGERTGTLVLVTHSYCYPETLGEAGPVFNFETTPSQNGLLTNLFRKRPGVVRSIHATHSLAASGPFAADVVRDHHSWDSPTGPGTPYSRLVHGGASALMFGVTFHSYTFFHTAEFEADSEHAFQAGVLDRLRVVDEGGAVRECLCRRQNWAPMRFAAAGELLERKGLVRRVSLGREFLRYVPDVAKVHDFLLERLRKHPDFLRESCAVDLY